MTAYTQIEAIRAGARPIGQVIAAQQSLTAIWMRLNPMTSINPILNATARTLEANAITIGRSVKDFGKPEWGIDHTVINGLKVAVDIVPIVKKPFGDLIHFKRDEAAIAGRNDPKILVIGPMSGHYLTLLRGTMEEYLPGAEVYGTDWHNARDVSRADAPKFDQDDQIAYIREFIEHLSPNLHIIAVCQPSGPAITALSQMAQDGAPNQPLSLTVVAGPVDTAANPSEISEFPHHALFSPFLSASTSTVPRQYAGAGRRVHMGYAQLSGFVAPNLQKHIEKLRGAHMDRVRGDIDGAIKTETFYDEYLAVMDLPREFIDQHCQRTFVNRDLANGSLVVQGQHIQPSSVSKTALMTIEGSKDDISCVGQTEAAHRILTGVPAHKRFHHVEEGAGHYGSFEGSRFRSGIAPRVMHFIREQGEQAGLRYSAMPIERQLIEPTRWQWSTQKPQHLVALTAATA
ncbi:MAG: polyhydroxyalkanoate depolymerase [Alphaproteobacteria bacterium]|nr:polyhydroxyalkanoate depolymerase [Alphaproteobacteria bacterium]NCQ87873.1 polyhydroxyalkanoate depolymerase [Alphaproteobacteria bacterium]NCT05619.1 polyhydroxyalkanoate depolymerase [Alphaproteobacteria bacterium]